jgi:hypothetical protein
LCVSPPDRDSCSSWRIVVFRNKAVNQRGARHKILRNLLRRVLNTDAKSGFPDESNSLFQSVLFAAASVDDRLGTRNERISQRGVRA